MKRFIPAILFLGIAVLGFAAHHAAFPLAVERSFETLEPVAQGVLKGDFEPGYQLKINKDALPDFEVSVRLPDGRELPRFPRPGALMSAEGEPGFATARPEVFLRLPADLQDLPPETVTAVLPIKLKQTLHEVSALLALLSLIAAAAGRGPIAIVGDRKARWQALAAVACAALAAAVLVIMIGSAKGPYVWLCLLVATLGVWGFLSLAAASLRIRVAGVVKGGLQSTGMVLASILFGLVIAEFFLGFAGGSEAQAKKQEVALSRPWFHLPEDIVRAALTRSEQTLMPRNWQRRRVQVEAAERAYYWHEVLHFEDNVGFRRRNGPFPEKGDAYRIMVVGDSKTYGGGVAEEWTYSGLLERALQKDYRIDVVNLGRPGFQSEDILGVIQGYTPELLPDLIIYGINVNDFLPSGQGGYISYQLPLPGKWKEYFNRRTRVSPLLGRGYDALVALLGLRHDYVDDIIDAESPYRTDFTKNLERMNHYVLSQGMPPILGLFLVLPMDGKDPRIQRIAGFAQSAMTQAGFKHVPVPEPDLDLSPGDLMVSAWDGHPNELGHSLIAESLYETIHLRGDLEPFREPQRQNRAQRR